MDKKYDFFDDIDDIDELYTDDDLYNDLLNPKENNKYDDLYDETINYDSNSLKNINGEEIIEEENNDDVIEDIEAEIIDEVECNPKTMKKNNKKNKRLGIMITAFIGVLLLTCILLFKGCSKNKKYTIKFDSDGGSDVLSQTIKYNEKANEPSDPVKMGYTFQGWYLGEKRYDFDSKVKSNLVLKAHWKEDTSELTGISIEQSSITILPGDTRKILVTFEPIDASADITWTSSNEEIVTVDDSGVITAIKEGTVIVTATTVDGNYTAACSVTVSNDAVKVSGIILNQDDFTINKGDTFQLTPVITPTNASDKSLLWTSSNDSVATIVNGKITALSAGSSTITVITNDGNYKDSLVVTVKDTKSNSNSNTTPIVDTSLKLNKTRLTLEEGSTITLVATVTPTTDTLTWTSSDQTVASVQNGKVVAHSPGDATITVKSSSGETASCTIKVAQAVQTNQDVYVVNLTPIKQEEIDTIKEYSVSVTKNNALFTDYTSIIYNDKTVTSLVDATDINTSITSAQIKLSTGDITAQVVYND